MSLYRYRAYNAAGETVSGLLEAASLSAAEHRLREGGVWLLDAREAGAVEKRAERPAAGRSRVGRRELIGFFVEMSLLLRAGITLPHALERLADDFRGQRLGLVLSALHEGVTTGTTLHQAMEDMPRVFPSQVVAMVQAGEAGGRLPEVFENLTAYYQWLDQLLGDVRQALVYPLVVTGATLSLIVGLFTFIVPRFVDLLHGLTLKVPLMTQIVMAISAFIMKDWAVLLGAAICIPLAFKTALRSPTCARAIDRALMRLPVFGSLVVMFALSRFTQNLGMLCRAGIPLLRALEISRNLVGNQAMAQALDEVRQGVSEGAPLSRCLGRYDFFPPSTVTMIAAGEASGKLDFSLQSISDYYNKIIPRRIKMIFSIFDPIVMVSLIGTVGFVALAVVLPILQLWNAR